MNSFDIKMFQGKDIEKIKDDWRFVTNAMSVKHFSQLYESAKSDIDTRDDKDIRFVYFFIMYKNGIPIAIFPLQELTIKIAMISFRTFTVFRQKDADFGDFIYEKNEDNISLIKILGRYLQKQFKNGWDCMVLPVVEDSSIYFSLRGKRYFSLIINVIGREYYFRCASYAQIWETLSKKFKSNIKRARNRLFCQNKVEIVYIRDEVDIEWAYQKFVDIESSGWKGQSGSSINSCSQTRDYYRNLMLSFSRMGKSEINFLKFNDTFIAGSLCVFFDGTLYRIKSGYRENYSYLCPGVTLFDELLRKYCEDSSVNEINACGSAEWLSSWNPLSLKCFTITIFSPSLRGFCCHFLLELKNVKQSYSKKMKALVMRFGNFIKGSEKNGCVSDKEI